MSLRRYGEVGGIKISNPRTHPRTGHDRIWIRNRKQSLTHTHTYCKPRHDSRAYFWTRFQSRFLWLCVCVCECLFFYSSFLCHSLDAFHFRSFCPSLLSMLPLIESSTATSASRWGRKWVSVFFRCIMLPFNRWTFCWSTRQENHFFFAAGFSRKEQVVGCLIEL